MATLRVAVTGAEGMLGSTLMSRLVGLTLIPLTKSNCDITNSQQVLDVFENIRPDVVIHCAAMTAVDQCEIEPAEAWKTNAFGTRNVAHASYLVNAKLIFISTDYVFDGFLDRPYSEYDRPTGGLNVYARSKWAAEESVRSLCSNHLIVRVSWLYGKGGPSFLHTMLNKASNGSQILKVVDDQVGNPTSTDAVSDALNFLIKERSIAGTIHLTCEGEATWYEFAKKIFEIKGIRQKIIPCRTSDYPVIALRPKNSRLEKAVLRQTGLFSMPHWEDALRDFLSRDQI